MMYSKFLLNFFIYPSKGGGRFCRMYLKHDIIGLYGNE